MHKTETEKRYLYVLTLGALGVVYGDIGTSPLYALRECFSQIHGIPLNEANVLGLVSLIIWALILIISLKYLLFVMKADNRGEGGVLALTALIQQRDSDRGKQVSRIALLLGIFGAALLYGDGIITPAISVLSAIEGLTVATPFFEPYVVALSMIILFVLFLFQKKGTAKIGYVFGPIILAWFTVLGLLGLRGVFFEPSILLAFSPTYALGFLLRMGVAGFLSLGAVFLAVTGAEALYADMGHFGKKPIRLGWFAVVFPGLVLNYLGQGALLLSKPEAVSNPFYMLAPKWALYPLVILATAATVIASQALISGVYSLTRQAVLLGYLPRLNITHTSSRQIGQIYIPAVNTALLIGTIWLVLTFRSSSNLAAAYGVAVSVTMLITTILLYIVARHCWKWSDFWAKAVTLFFLLIDGCFVIANVSKVFQGGWVPLAIAIAVVTMMLTWRRGGEILAARVQSLTPPLAHFMQRIKTDPTIRVPGTAIFMTRNIAVTPPALLHNVKHNTVLHKTVILLMITTEDRPRVAGDQQLSVDELGEGFYRVIVRCGFMDEPNLPDILERCASKGLCVEVDKTTFFFGRESLIAARSSGMAPWREKLFLFMSRNAQRATIFYRIPPQQVIEIGFQLEF